MGTRKSLANIQAQTSLLLSAEYLKTGSTNQELHVYNPFTNKSATIEQQYNLLHFRTIGQDEFERHVAYLILKEVSVNPPIRKKRLLTLSKRKATSRQVTQLEKDRMVVQKCLHKNSGNQN